MTHTLDRRSVNVDPALSPYNYIPTDYVCGIFIVLYGLSTLTHVGQSIRYRMWWLFPTVILAGLAEVAGWSARFWSSQNPTLATPFLMQITTTIIAPTPLLAANFIILGRIIRHLGVQYSRLSPKWYTIIFCSCDVIALIVQAFGGAIASGSNASNPQQSENGGHIMLGGIIFQLVALTFYVIFAAEFLTRAFTDKPVRDDQSDIASATSDSFVKIRSGTAAMGKDAKVMVVALAFTTLCLFIRSIYRTIELSDGWNGRIISTQVYFNVLDGAMVTLAIFTLNFFHPGRLLKEQATKTAQMFSGKV